MLDAYAGAPNGAPPPSVLAAGSHRCSSRPTPHRAEWIRHRVLKPDQALAPLVGLGLVAHAADRKRPGNRLERLDADGDADLVRSRGRDEGVRCRQFHRHVAAIAPCPDDMTRRLHPVERMKLRQAHLSRRRREALRSKVSLPAYRPASLSANNATVLA
jgi:hypothetical protein